MKKHITQFPTFFRIILLFIIISSVTGCWEKEDITYTIQVDETILNFSEETTQLSFNITSSGSWQIEGAYLVGDTGLNSGTADWFKIDKMYGHGNATITILTLNNTIPSLGNSTVLHIKGNFNQVTVKLRQDARKSEVN